MTAIELRKRLAVVLAERRRNYKTVARNLTAAILAIESNDTKE